MNSTSVDLKLHTLQSSFAPGQQPITLEEAKKLFETAVVEGGVWADGEPVLLQVVSGQPGQSFSMKLAPQLTPPFEGEALSVDAAMALLSHLQTTLFQLNLVSNAIRTQIDALTQSINLEQQRDDNLAQIDAEIAARAAGRMAEAADGAAMGGALLGAGIAIALAAIFTGGLALVVAAAAATVAVLEVGSAIAKAAGAKSPFKGPDGRQNELNFTVAGLVQMSIDGDYDRGRIVIAEQRPDGSWQDKNGNTIADPRALGVMVMSQTQFNNHYAYTGMALSLALGVGMMIGGFAVAKMAVDAAKFAANVTKLNSLLGTTMSTRTVQQLGTAAEAGTAVVEGSTNVVNGATQVNLAVKQEMLEKLKAALEHLKSQIDFMSQHMNLMQKLISEQAEKLNESQISTIRSIGDYYRGQTQIAHNLTPMS
ncbi:MAG: hypothetical protein GTN86_12595 [Xanthomonadales bacterium]|uniref:hypothetical protein n=1 Tax=Hydrogenophaga sp. TaxID=1904254 RepID=UPI0016968BA5|nr:hypothetical protein [Hydrogenophaga sp.]NIQ36731.1 hypothetical protein [Xanthomonadales bacterium]NIM41999.1 hypothetical protein [Hydrogenophaga sp.]NIN27302.1 hypothetical protein [Hydrogenophaga sp.]NIN32003.1 hypothetical protein [Hydrogenophaga sp.]NIN56155.1 hypothetical protein [Hydrogenophaga sp.]